MIRKNKHVRKCAHNKLIVKATLSCSPKDICHHKMVSLLATIEKGKGFRRASAEGDPRIRIASTPGMGGYNTGS